LGAMGRTNDKLLSLRGPALPDHLCTEK